MNLKNNKTTNNEELEMTIRKMFHDLRSYAGIAMNSVELLKQEISDKDIQDDYRQLFDIAINSLEQQLDLMETSKEKISTQPNNMIKTYEPINLKQMLQDNYSLTTNLATQKNLQLLKNYDHLDDEFTINTNKTGLNSILHNVITNAIKYTNEGFVELGCEMKPDDLRIYVKDSGIGIPKNDLINIFEYGYRASNSTEYEGTGYGLNMVQEQIKQLGACVDIDSIEGKGTTVNINLPIKYN